MIGGLIVGHVVLLLCSWFGTSTDTPDFPKERITASLGCFTWVYVLGFVFVAFFVEGWATTIIVGIILVGLLVFRAVIHSEIRKEEAALRESRNPNLTNCHPCGHTVSVQAATCPSCGAPLR